MLGNHCLKKSNYGFGGKPSEVIFEEWRGWSGRQLLSYAVWFCVTRPQTVPTGVSPCSRRRPNAGRVAQRKQKCLVARMSPSLMSTQEGGKLLCSGFSKLVSFPSCTDLLIMNWVSGESASKGPLILVIPSRPRIHYYVSFCPAHLTSSCQECKSLLPMLSQPWKL